MYPPELRDRVVAHYRAHQPELTYRETGRIFQVSYKTVERWCKETPEERARVKGPYGPKKKTTARDEAALRLNARRLRVSGARVTARKVRAEAGLEALSLRTIQRRMQGLRWKYAEVRRQIVLTAQHKQARLQLCRQWLINPPDPNRLVFTDEKRFNFDGPDSWASWMAEGDQLVRNRRQQGGGSVQVYGALLPGPILCIWPLPARGRAADFMAFMEEDVLPFISVVMESGFILQQDNAPVHVAAESRRRFEALGVELLPWPARSPDLNIIENCWAYLSERVYDGPQYTSRESLLEAIDEAVTRLNTIDRDKLEALFESFPKRLLECVELRGG